MVHCDDLIDDPAQPECLRKFLAFKRAPATEQWQRLDAGEKVPTLFAKVKETGEVVRVVMASRFGDVGITARLYKENGYERRVHCDALTDFKEKRHV